MWDWLTELLGGGVSDGASLDWLLGASDAAPDLVDFAPQALDLSNAPAISGFVDNAAGWMPDAVDFGSSVMAAPSFEPMTGMNFGDAVPRAIDTADDAAYPDWKNPSFLADYQGPEYGARDPSWYDPIRSAAGTVTEGVRGVTAPVSDFWGSLNGIEKLGLGLGGLGALGLAMKGLGGDEAPQGSDTGAAAAAAKQDTRPLQKFVYPNGKMTRDYYGPGTKAEQLRAGYNPARLYFGKEQAVGMKRGGLAGGQDDVVPAMLAHGEYVIPADVVSGLGDGYSKAGAQKLDAMVHGVRGHKGGLPPRARDPKSYTRSA